MFAFETVYYFPKFYLLAALTGAIALTTALAAYTWCSGLPAQRKASLLIFLVVVLVMQSAQFLAVVSPPAEFLFFTGLQLAAFFFIWPAFACFIAVFLHGKPPGAKTKGFFVLFPLAGLAILLARQGHGLLYRVDGGFFVSYGPVTYFIMFGGYCLVLAALLASPGRGGGRMWFILAVSFLFAIDLWQLLRPSVFPYHLFPANVAVGQLIVLAGYAGKRKSLGSLLSLRAKVLDSLNEAVMMADQAGNVAYANQAFSLLEAEGLPGFRTGEAATGELTLEGPVRRHYTYSIQALKNRRGWVAGTLYAFREITAYKELILALAGKNRELAAARAKLESYATVVRQVSEEEERNRILTNVRQTVGEQIVKIINIITSQTDDGEKGKEKILQAIECTRDGIQAIRESVALLKANAGQSGGGAFID